jgi:hypothetical protein
MARTLSNIGVLGWGISGETSFMGALARVMEYYKEKIDYVDLMGFSGAAFRINIAQPNWCPSAPDMFPRTHFAKYFGYELSPYFNHEDDEKKRTEKQKELYKLIKRELSQEHPVLGIDMVKIPEWGIITGIKGDTLYCRTYYDGFDKDYDLNNLPEYNEAEKEPWGVYTIVRIGMPMDRKKAIKECMKWALQHWSLGKIEEKDKEYYANGINAYEVWINQLLEEERHRYTHEQMHQRVTEDTFFQFLDTNPYLMNMQANAWMYNAYYDARVTAVKFLDRISSEYTGAAQDLLLLLMEQYKKVVEYMYLGWLDFPFPFWVDWDNNRMSIYGKNELRYCNGMTIWDSNMRKRASHTLRLVREEEKKAYSIMARLVNLL